MRTLMRMSSVNSPLQIWLSLAWLLQQQRPQPLLSQLIYCLQLVGSSVSNVSDHQVPMLTGAMLSQVFKDWLEVLGPREIELDLFQVFSNSWKLKLWFLRFIPQPGGQLLIHVYIFLFWLNCTLFRAFLEIFHCCLKNLFHIRESRKNVKVVFSCWSFYQFVHISLDVPEIISIENVHTEF